MFVSRCRILLFLVFVSTSVLTAACGSESKNSITVYSGRSQDLIGPIIEDFVEQTGIQVQVKYAGTAELAATLLEEGQKSPADVYIAQDAGALGAIEAGGLLADLDDELLDRVPNTFSSPNGKWVGISGRARTIVYNTETVDPKSLPTSILDFTNPQWKGKIGWAPTNGSFQAFVTALRIVHGEDGAREWLEGIKDNDPVEYPKNTPIVAATAAGEIAVGFVNHYYLHRFLAEEGKGFKARNFYTGPGDVGTLINVAGAAILESSDSKDVAGKLLGFLLSEQAQLYFTNETYEYPLIDGVQTRADLPSVSYLQPVQLDLGRLEDLEGTLKLLRETGVLP